mgnify:CR=1 FL=1|tara:strand:- start:209 stop:835 length:627 start_codon:yes stop_codon:yes gene_type:complete
MTSFTKKAQRAFIALGRELMQSISNTRQLADVIYNELISLGVKSVDELYVNTAKQLGDRAILSVEFLHTLTDELFRAKQGEEIYFLANVAHDDPRLDGSGKGNTARTKTNAAYWKKQKGSGMKDFRNQMKVRFNEAQGKSAGGARKAKLPHERLDSALMEVGKALVAAKKGDAITYSDDAIKALESLYKMGKGVVKVMDQEKQLPSEQ